MNEWWGFCVVLRRGSCLLYSGLLPYLVVKLRELRYLMSRAMADSILIRRGPIEDICNAHHATGCGNLACKRDIIQVISDHGKAHER